MGFYTNNGGLIGTGAISSRIGVHDIDRARLNPITTAVIPTTNLYSHWDFSKLSDAVTTTYNVSGTVIPGSSGLSIGASSTTPALTYLYTTSQQTCQITSTSSGKKVIGFTAGGASNVGSRIQSAGNAYPDITASGYTWISVWGYTSAATGYVRPYRWVLGAYANEYNHGTFFANTPTSTGEFDVINYASAQVAVAAPATLNARGGIATTIMIDIITVTNTALKYNCYVNATNYTGTATVSTVTYGTQGDANRYLQIFDNVYSTIRPGAKYYELAFYSAPLSDADAASTASALYTKWTT